MATKKRPINYEPKPGSKYARKILTQEQSINLAKDGIPIENLPPGFYEVGDFSPLGYASWHPYHPFNAWRDFKLHLIGYFDHG